MVAAGGGSKATVTRGLVNTDIPKPDGCMHDAVEQADILTVRLPLQKQQRDRLFRENRAGITAIFIPIPYTRAIM